MKILHPRSFTREHAAIIIVLSLIFLGLFSISRSSAQVEEGRHIPARMRSENMFGAFDYEAFLARIENGAIPDQSGPVRRSHPSIL